MAGREEFNACDWLVDRHVREGRGDRVALRGGGRPITYEELLGRVHQVANGLRSLAVRPEERVGMIMLDSVEFVATFLGALRIGAVPVPTNPLLPVRDLGVIMADARARVVVISGERMAAVDGLRSAAPEIEVEIVTGTSGNWDEAMDDDTPSWAYATWDESPGFWLCTSGTTGQPKLAMHRHADLRVTQRTYAEHVLGVTSDDRCFSVGPMFHAYGLGNSLTFPLAVGATSILEPTRPPTPALVAGICRVEEPTLFFCIPTFYAALNASDLPEDTFASVRLAVSAAEPLPAETFLRFRERFGVTILDGIGSTEMLHIFLSNTEPKQTPGTSGVPVPGYEVRVVDDSGADAPDDEPGQLLVRGESAATGYWCRADTSRSTFAGDWVRTGDLYVRDAEGCHTYLGRVDDMLRVGGEWVSPAEVEGVLVEHPAVLEAAVVGERDEKDILRPIAFVVPKEGATADPEDLAAHCRDRLAGYKRPRRFEVVEDLPKTATGKIQRFKLRAGS